MCKTPKTMHYQYSIPGRFQLFSYLVDSVQHCGSLIGVVRVRTRRDS